MVGEIIGIIGGTVAIIIGVSTILGWFVFLGGWKNKVEEAIKRENDCAKVVPPAVQDLQTKLNWIYQLQMAEVLERQRLAVQEESLTTRQSPMKLTERGQKCAQKVEALIKELSELPSMKPTDILTELNKRIDVQEFNNIAKSEGCTSQELVAVIFLQLGLGYVYGNREQKVG